MNRGKPWRMNLLRRAGELVIGLAVIVMFAPLLAMPELDEGVRADGATAGEHTA